MWKRKTPDKYYNLTKVLPYQSTNSKDELAADAAEVRDRILLRRAIHDKDREALGRLHTIYHQYIIRYIALRIESLEDAEDLTQRVFLELCRSSSTTKRYRHPKAYLLGIAKNLIALYYRSKSRQVKTIPIESVDEIRAGDEARRYRMSGGQLSPRERKTIQTLVAQLPPKAREAVRLRFLKGLSPKDAAKISGCSANTFYQRLNAGVKAIKELGNKSDPHNEKLRLQKNGSSG